MLPAVHWPGERRPPGGATLLGAHRAGGVPLPPIVPGGVGCKNPVIRVGCDVVGHVTRRAVSHAASVTVGSVLRDIAQWVASAAAWLLARIGTVMEATTRVSLDTGWFLAHERVMASLAATVVVPVLLGALIQAILRQSPEIALRAAFVNLPLALLLTGVAVQLVQLGVGATDQMSATVSAGSGGALHRAFARLIKFLGISALNGRLEVPSLVVLMAALLVVLGSLALWLELLVRSAAIYVAVLFLPLALASLVWPAVSHWARRLVDTLAALILSKFAIVAILSLAVGALASGSGGSAGIASVLGAAALLILAAFAPFVLLRLIPMAQQALVTEGAAVRLQRTVTAVPRTAARYALRHVLAARLPLSFAGTGMESRFEAAGGDDSSTASDEGGTGGGPSSGGGLRGAPEAGGARRGGPGAGGQGVPMWRGTPASDRAIVAAMGSAGAGTGGRGASDGGDPSGPSRGTGRGPVRGVPVGARGAAAGERPDVAGERPDIAEADPGAPLGASGSTVLRLGGPPVWGRPLEAGADAVEAEPASFATSHRVERDAFGPVIRWTGNRGHAPAPDAGSPPPDAHDVEPSDGIRRSDGSWRGTERDS